MNTLPYCPLPITHPARAYTPGHNTNVAETIATFREQHAPIMVCPVGDDYDEVERLAYLEQPGAFK